MNRRIASTSACSTNPPDFHSDHPAVELGGGRRAMKWQCACAAAFALIPAAAHADCMADAIKARAAILASGPFHLDARRSWGGNDWRHYARGEVEPDRAIHLTQGPTMYISEPDEFEHISTGDKTWEKGTTGWYQPENYRYFPLWFAPPAGDKGVLAAKCLGQVEIDGKNLIGYELEFADAPEKVFVDPGSGLTVRYERQYSHNERLEGVISTFSYDPSIKIEPPEVAPDAPKAPPPIFAGAAKKF
jgi:hypothetical protein